MQWINYIINQLYCIIYLNKTSITIKQNVNTTRCISSFILIYPNEATVCEISASQEKLMFFFSVKIKKRTNEAVGLKTFLGKTKSEIK